MSQSVISEHYFDFLSPDLPKQPSLFKKPFFFILETIRSIEARAHNLSGVWLLMISLIFFSVIFLISFFAIPSINPLQFFHIYCVFSLACNYAFLRSIRMTPYPELVKDAERLFLGSFCFKFGFSFFIGAVNLIELPDALFCLSICAIPAVAVEIFLEKSSGTSMVYRVIWALFGTTLIYFPIGVYKMPFSSDFYYGCFMGLLGGLLMIKPVHVISCRTPLANLMQICFIFQSVLVILLPVGFDFIEMNWPSLPQWALMLFCAVLSVPLQYFLVRGMQLEPISSILHVFLMFSIIIGAWQILILGPIDFWYLIPIGSLLLVFSFLQGIKERKRFIQYKAYKLSLLEGESQNSREMYVIRH